MGYIYKISNDINDKLYIGKTQLSIQERWSEHLRDFKRRINEKRPLYRAMNKYGIEHFYIEQIGEYSNLELSEKEKYWIDYYDSYFNGYNATKGGDGRPYVDYDLIYNLWNKGLNKTQIRKETGHDIETIGVALKSFGITQEEIIKRGQESNKKMANKVVMIDKNTNEILQIFDSQADAAFALGKSRNSGGTIGRACRGEREIAFGYKWKYIEDEE